MREELEKRLGSLQLELMEAASAQHKAQRDLNLAKLRSEDDYLEGGKQETTSCIDRCYVL